MSQGQQIPEEKASVRTRKRWVPTPPSEAAVQRLRDALADGEWHLARELRQSHGLNDRTLRNILHWQEEPEFISTDQGYRLAAYASREEKTVCADRLMSQGRKMIKRSLALRALLRRTARKGDEGQPELRRFPQTYRAN